MKMRKFRSNKLWRDKTVNFYEQLGSKIHWTELDTHQFSEQLKMKLLEEAQEVCNANTRESLLEELADVLELVSSLCTLHEATLQDIVDLQHEKHQEKGGFQGRKFVAVAEHPPGSPGEKYCLADPEKYPEITE